MTSRPSTSLPKSGRLARWGLCGSALALGLVLAGGCQSVAVKPSEWVGGPFFVPTNFSGMEILPAEVRRVALLPTAGLEALPPDSAESISGAVQAALLAEARFEVVVVDPKLLQELGAKRAIASSERLPADLFTRLQQEYGIEAVLFVDVTYQRAYAPLALGVRTKLALVAAPHGVIWAFDTLYDVRDPAVGNSARRFAARGGKDVADGGPASLQSPSRFAAYVFADVFGTLPKRPPPAPAARQP